MQISRPRLNYLIIVGVILFYISMILFAVPTNNKSVLLALFKVQPWTLSLGFSFCYGTIIMKMFRVYYIINNPLPNKVSQTAGKTLTKLLYTLVLEAAITHCRKSSIA